MDDTDPFGPPAHSDMCPEQVVIRHVSPPADGAALLDPFGRLLPVGSTLFVGRISNQREHELVIAEPSVSRQHAEITGVSPAYLIRDLGSRNGTFVNGEPVTDPRPLKGDDIVQFGDVQFTFVDYAEAPDLDVSWSTMEAQGSAGARLQLAPLSLGGGGVARFGAKTVQLAGLPFELLKTLATRANLEANSAADVRGFVRAAELLVNLPWDTPHPDDNHVKQTVRRLRRALAEIGLPDAIEARQGMGYRLIGVSYQGS